MDINPQPYANSIEKILKKVFDCDRAGLSNVINSDFIRKNPLSAMLAGAAYLYAKAENKETSKEQEEIESFISDHWWHIKMNMSIDKMLEFETSTKNENGTTIDIGFENGKDAIESITKNFRKICSEK